LLIFNTTRSPSAFDMENEFDEIMKQHSDAELIEILNSQPGDYKDSAMESAKREFRSRNLSPQKIEDINEAIKQKKYEEEVEAFGPADKPSRLSAFFFPGLSYLYLSDGSERDQGLATYTIFGYIFYGFVVGLLLILRYYFHWHFLD
jgi:hypothetical protein